MTAPSRAGGAVTVVVPTHNRGALLKPALGSVSVQGHSVTRVVVVDDGSTDSTPAWLEEFGARQRGEGRGTSWQFLRHATPRGGSAARNAGLAVCDTPFVLFLDDDDVLRPGAVALLAAALARHPEAAGAAGRFRRFGAVPEEVHELHPRFGMTIAVWREELFGWNMPPSALLWRTDVVREIGAWDPALRRSEDRDLNLRAFPRPFTLIGATVMDYRVHPGQPPASAQVEVDRLVLTRFVASLPPGRRAVGAAILDARRHLDAGLVSYRSGDFRAARPHFVRMARRAPVLMRSPILGPWLCGLVVKAALSSAAPGRAAAIQTARQHRRRGASSPPSSPEQNAMA